MANILEIAKSLEQVPDGALQQMTQRPDSEAPAYLVVSEINRRNKLRQGSALNTGAAPTVAEQVTSQIQAQTPYPTVPQGGVQKMAGGGIVAFANGGLIVRRARSMGYTGKDDEAEARAWMRVHHPKTESMAEFYDAHQKPIVVGGNTGEAIDRTAGIVNSTSGLLPKIAMGVGAAADVGGAAVEDVVGGIADLAAPAVGRANKYLFGTNMGDLLGTQGQPSPGTAAQPAVPPVSRTNPSTQPPVAVQGTDQSNPDASGVRSVRTDAVTRPAVGFGLMPQARMPGVELIPDVEGRTAQEYMNDPQSMMGEDEVSKELAAQRAQQEAGLAEDKRKAGWMALMRGGIDTMIAGGQPGATFLGAVGEGAKGGVGALLQSQKDMSDTEKAIRAAQMADLARQRGEKMANVQYGLRAAREDVTAQRDVAAKNAELKTTWNLKEMDIRERRAEVNARLSADMASLRQRQLEFDRTIASKEDSDRIQWASKPVELAAQRLKALTDAGSQDTKQIENATSEYVTAKEAYDKVWNAFAKKKGYDVNSGGTDRPGKN